MAEPSKDSPSFPVAPTRPDLYAGSTEPIKGGVRVPLPDGILPKRPKLTITRETSAEVRSVPSVGNCQVIVHPKLDGPGGMQAEIPAEHINRADRLAPKCRLYCYEGIEERDGRVQRVIVYYALGSKETYDEARAAMTAGCEVV
jgi:hypothetical protein